MCVASPISYASVGNDETLQKIHWKKRGRLQGRAYERSCMEFFEIYIFETFLKFWVLRRLEIRIERIEKIQFDGANYEIHGISIEKLTFWDFFIFEW